MTGEPTVWIVDDDDSVRRSFARLLRSAGVRVVECSSAREFLDASPDGCGCVILDLHMPDITGLELLEKLAGAPHPLPVIVLSGNANFKTIQCALAGGAAGFLVKPVEDELLLESIRSALGAPLAGKF
jgi:two-component system response regulator FixJ